MIDTIAIERIETGTTKNHDRAGNDGRAGTDSGDQDESGHDGRTSHVMGPAITVAMAFKRFISLPSTLINSCLQHCLVTSNGDRGSTDVCGSRD